MHIFNVTFDSISFSKQQRFISQQPSYQEVHDFISSRSILQWGHFSWFVDTVLSLSQLLFFLCVRPSRPNYPQRSHVLTSSHWGLGCQHMFWEDANIQPLKRLLASSMCGGRHSSSLSFAFGSFWYAILRKIDGLHFNTIEFRFCCCLLFCVLLTKLHLSWC